ncbi:PTS sugar transporter subunit IIA [Enemella sp. A6]|uniref:PTS sugar transporter subunit IIA n=1 Tax=Enemella sp. A6 TaxID=3440152 RepID=UPI003EC004A5
MTKIISPVAGRVIPLAEVADPVFSEQMLGPGVGIEPRPGKSSVIAPAAGKLVKVHPHAVAMQTSDGLALLVHLGINTVKLDGAGFEVLVADGDEVSAGQELIRWDVDRMVGDDIHATVLMVVMERPADSLELPCLGKDVQAGDELFTA